MQTLANLARLCRRAWRALRQRQRPPPQPGYWRDASASSWRGWLMYAPWLPPTRDYKLYIPSGYRDDAPQPLLVMLHGCKQSPEEFAAGTRMNQLADKNGFLVLYPKQARRYNPYRCWNWFDPLAHRGGGEAAIVAAATAAVSGHYAVDKRRVYVTGLSAGAALAVIVALRYPQRFAAATIHAGLPYAAAASPAGALHTMRAGVASHHLVPVPIPRRALLHAARLPSFAVFHGSADNVVNPSNADQLLAQLLDGFAKLYKETPRAEETRANDGRPYRLRCYRGARRLLLSEYRIDGLGHAWSGGDGSLPYNDPLGPDASALSWEFLRRQTL